MKGMILRLHSRMLDHGPGIGLQTGHGATDMTIDLDDLLDGRGLKQRGGDALLDAEDDTIVGRYLRRT